MEISGQGKEVYTTQRSYEANISLSRSEAAELMTHVIRFDRWNKIPHDEINKEVSDAHHVLYNSKSEKITMYLSCRIQVEQNEPFFKFNTYESWFKVNIRPEEG